MSRETFTEFVEIRRELMDSARCNDALRHEFAKDRLQRLPGFPSHMNPDLDWAEVFVDEQPSRIITIGSKH